MLSLYRQVTVEAARRAIAAWPVALSFVVYAVILIAAIIAFAPLGIIGGFLVGFVVAACWSSYLELVSQAVAGSKIRIRWDDFKHTFLARFWDVISVMFAFWIISLATTRSCRGPNGAGRLGRHRVRDRVLLQRRARAALPGPLALFRAADGFGPLHVPVPGGVAATERPVRRGRALRRRPASRMSTPGRAVILFGSTFSSPAASLDLRRPPALGPAARALRLHYAMIFRGILFRELVSGGGNTRLRAFQAKMRG